MGIKYGLKQANSQRDNPKPIDSDYFRSTMKEYKNIKRRDTGKLFLKVWFVTTTPQKSDFIVSVYLSSSCVKDSTVEESLLPILENAVPLVDDSGLVYSLADSDVPIDFDLSVRQFLTFVVILNEEVSHHTSSLTRLIFNTNTNAFKINKNTTLNLRLRAASKQNEIAEFEFSFRSHINKESRQLVLAFRKLNKHTRDDSTVAYITEPFEVKDGSSSIKPFKLATAQICDSSAKDPIRIDLFDMESKEHLGCLDTSLQVMSIPSCVLPIINSQRKEVALIKPRLRIQAGENFYSKIFSKSLDSKPGKLSALSFSKHICIDFTSSNVNYDNPRSLHCIQRVESSAIRDATNDVDEYLRGSREDCGSLGDESLEETGRFSIEPVRVESVYEKAIRMICSFMDFASLESLTGLGAIPKTCRQLSGQSVFDFGGVKEAQYGFSLIDLLDDSPGELSGLEFDGIADIYRKSLPKLNFYGPTRISPVVASTLQRIKFTERYHFLFVIVDGPPSDFQETVDILIEASHSPLSIFFLGVGNCGFAQLEDIVTGSHCDRYNRKAVRNFCAFVKIEDDTHELHLRKVICDDIINHLNQYYEILDAMDSFV